MPTVSTGLYRWLFLKGATLEDFADRLNHVWTVGLLLILAAVISWKQGASKPIACWSPPHFTAAYHYFTETQCWNSHLIVYPRDLEKAYDELNLTNPHGSLVFTEQWIHVPTVTSWSIGEDDTLISKMATTVTLYQWLPVILVFQALLFKLPSLIMYVLHSYSGLSFNKLAGLTDGYENLNIHDRQLLARQTGRYLYSWCKQFGGILPWRFLTLVWLLVKVLFCVNVVVQTVLLNSYLRTTDPPVDNTTSYGNVIGDNIFQNNGSLWKQSPVFPRQIMCDFAIRNLQNIQRFRVQCQLPINEFNERAYILLWVWKVFVSTATCVSLIVWMITTVIPIFRKRFITKSLSLSECINIDVISPYEVDRFADIVGEDGVMALKLIGANCSEHMVCDVISTMWKMKADEDERNQGHFNDRQHETIDLPLLNTEHVNVTTTDKCAPPYNSDQNSMM